METFVGVFRCFLPVRYWQEMRRGAILSIFVTFLSGTFIGLNGFLEYARRSDAASVKVAEAGGVTQQQMMGMGSLSAISFFLLTPLGWLADYLFLSAMFRGVALAVDDPWGDPILTGIDYAVRGKHAKHQAKKAATERELAEGVDVPDQILECKKFAGKEADYVVVACRQKEGWTKNTTVVADSVRLRVGDPLEKTLEGKLRSCYPLKVIRDLQVDRRIVHYEWPADAPPLPDLAAEAAEAAE